MRKAPRNLTPYALHAANALLDWARPDGMPDDWTPGPQQIIDYVAQHYGETITETDANTALAEIASRAAAKAA